MRRRLSFALALLILTLPAVSSAGLLTDFFKKKPDVKILFAAACDSGTTEVVMYSREDLYASEWARVSDRVFSRSWNKQGFYLYAVMTLGVGTSVISEEEWSKLIKEASPNYFKYVYGIDGDDCKPEAD